MVRVTPKRFLVVIMSVATVLIFIAIVDKNARPKLYRRDFILLSPSVRTDVAGSDVRIGKNEEHVIDAHDSDHPDANDTLILAGSWKHKTHSENKTLDEKLVEIKQEKKRTNVCPLWPDELIGPMSVSPSTNDTTIDGQRLKLIAKGGRYRPTHCEPRERTAIIIPYRDREKQLKILLSHLHNTLQKQKIEYGIYVIEMANPTPFNKGILANVGFMTATSIRDYTCYVIHDVDNIMVDDRNMYRCGRWPRHLVAYSSDYNYSLPYLSYFGGVVALTPDQFWKMNGYSNLFFGLGGEDEDAVIRLFSIGSHFSRPKKNIGGYVTLEHKLEPTTSPPNAHRSILLKSSEARRDIDGVKSIRYTRLALELRSLYTWVYISVNEAKTIEDFLEMLRNTQLPLGTTETSEEGEAFLYALTTMGLDSLVLNISRT